MAETTTTTGRAAAWNPPRLSRLALGGTRSGTKHDNTQWETNCPGASSPGYRMPTSGEVGTLPASC